MYFIDTQIISYAFSGNCSIEIQEKYMSSVAICEFLQVYKRDDLTGANYYPPLNHPIAFKIPSLSMPIVKKVFDSKKHSQQGKHRTDKILFDFGSDYPSYIEFGSFAITKLINERNKFAIMASANHMDKDFKKLLAEKIDFILSNKITCYPINKMSIELMLIVLDKIYNQVNLKENFRNSVNDLLIATIAYSNNKKLLTVDKLLNRILSEYLNISIETHDKDHLLLMNSDFSSNDTKNNNLESKGYINRSWRYRILKAR